MAADSLESLQQQLDNLADLHMIVRTMKALSAARIRQYEEAVEALAGYARTVGLGLHVALHGVDGPARAGPRSGGQCRGFVVFGSDHGLCGRFNEEIVRFALTGEPADPAPRIAVVGGRVADGLRDAGFAVDTTFEVPSSPPQITETVQQLLFTLDDWQARRGLEKLTLYGNRGHEGKTYQPMARRLLPLNLRELGRIEEAHWPSRSLPTFSMDRHALLSRLLHQHLFVSLFRACAESQASEHAARLDAMHAAQRNIEERLERVTTAFRRTRQEAITAELLEVVSGFDAVADPAAAAASRVGSERRARP